MAVARNIWKTSFDTWPRLPCPNCKSGSLRMDTKSIQYEETKGSKSLHSHDEWDPDWIDGRFSGMLTCNNPACRDHVFVCGCTSEKWKMYFDRFGEPDQDLERYYEPHFFEPAPPIFHIPNDCPIDVRENLIQAFSLMWSDNGS